MQLKVEDSMMKTAPKSQIAKPTVIELNVSKLDARSTQIAAAGLAFNKA